jgi:uncharacterized protein
MATGPDFRTNPTYAGSVDRASYDAGLRSHMLRVYNYMCGGLVLSGLIAFFASNSPTLMQAIFGSPLGIVVMLAPLGLILFASMRLHAIQASTLQTIYWVFCGLMGLSLSAVFIRYTGASVARVFFITAGMFLATSLYGYTTRRSLDRIGSFLFMGLIGILIAGIVNIFLGSSALQFAISVIGVLVFTGLTAWDTQRIKETYSQGLGSETTTKMAVFGALQLYLDFINLFQFLLMLMGNRRG